MEDNTKSKRTLVECPHCLDKYFVEINFTASVSKGEDGKDDFWENLSSDEQKFLESAQAQGLVKAFQQTAEIAKADQPPRIIEKFFLSWLKTAAPKSLPKFAFEFYKNENPGGEISVIGGNGILCILADKQIKCFVPSEIILGKNLRSARGSSLPIRTPVNQTDLVQWKRTRRGYVIGGSMFESELRTISIGSFAKPRFEIAGRR